MGGGSASKQPDPLYVDMGLPSGRLWAKSNLDVTLPNGFAASPFQYECTFFSWGNVEGHNPIPDDGFDYNWGTWEGSKTEDGLAYLPNSPYGITPGCALQSSITSNSDAARINIGLPWHIPTTADFTELVDNCDFVEADGITIIEASNKLISINNVNGIYLRSKINGSLLFFACSGNGAAKILNNRGTHGYYWSATYRTEVRGRCLDFSSTGVTTSNTFLRFNGCPIRPVI